MSAPDIFLSYNREDAARARLFADAFKAEGFEVWWDAHLKSGEAYDKVTEDALHDAKAVVVLWSTHSVDSRWVRAEATIGDRNGTLAPVMIEPCRRPVMFELTQTAELSHWKGDRTDPAWQAFIGDLRERVGREAPAPASATEELPESPAAKPTRDKRIVFAGVAAAMLALLGVGYFVLGFGGSSPLATQSTERIPVLIHTFETGTSGDADEAALANGITEELIQRLRRIPELQIATALPDGSAPSDVFASANTVEGTIRKSGERYLATARLTGPSGEILWSENFNFALADLLSMQQQLAVQISTALTVPLDVGANSRAYGGTDNPEAFALYIQGNFAVYGDLATAQQYVERAIALDPDFVKAQALLARTYALSVGRAPSDAERRRIAAKVDAASAAALEANPDLAESQLARAYHFIVSGNLESAYASYQRARELDPGVDPRFRENLALFAYAFGSAREALAIIQSRSLIDPAVKDDGFTIGMLLWNRRYQESVDMFHRMEAANGEPLPLAAIWGSAFNSLLLLGREEDAIAFARERNGEFMVEALNIFDRDPSMLQLDLAEWQRRTDSLTASGSLQGFSAYAGFAAYRGHHQLAVDLLRIEAERGSITALGGLWSPLLAETRKTDAFVQLVNDLGFPEVWRESGDWGDFCEPTEDGGITCH